MQIILASSSRYRKELLKRLKLSFSQFSPNINESLKDSVSLSQNVINIAKRKAFKIAEKQKNAIIIASDQLCAIENKILGKPHNFDNAFRQLKLASNKAVTFYTSLCVYNSKNQSIQTHCDETVVYFRQLGEDEIINYLHKDQPFDCAGSFKVEALGISLFQKIKSQDPSALEGLPLIKLCEMLRVQGVAI